MKLTGLFPGQSELVDSPYITVMPLRAVFPTETQLLSSDSYPVGMNASSFLCKSAEIPPEAYLFITVLKPLADRQVLSSGQLGYYMMMLFMGQFCIQAS